MTGAVEWPDVPEGSVYREISVSPMLVSLDCIHFYEVPEGMTVSEFLKELKGDG